MIKYLQTHGRTINQLMDEWQLDRKQVQLIRKIIMDQSFDLDQLESVQKLSNQCYNAPDRVHCQLTAINEIMDSHGIESIDVPSELYWDNYYGNSIGTYVNQGDTYILTVVYNSIDRYFEFISWGDYYESMEHRLEKEND